MTARSARDRIIVLVAQAITEGARQARACAVISLSERTLQRWQREPLGADQRPQRPELFLQHQQRCRLR